VPILGVNGVSVICHGSSHAKAIKSAIRVARQAYQEKLPSVIAKRIQQMSATSAAS
jgi:phosphate acyltransferase